MLILIQMKNKVRAAAFGLQREVETRHFPTRPENHRERGECKHSRSLKFQKGTWIKRQVGAEKVSKGTGDLSFFGDCKISIK